MASTQTLALQGGIARVAQLARALLHPADRSDSGTAKRMAAVAFVFRVLNAGIAFVSQVLMARWMGGSEFGVYIYTWVWVLVLGQVSNLGLASATQRFVPVYTSAGDHDGLRGFLSGVRLTGVAVATALMLIGLGGLWLFGDKVAQPMVLPFYLALFCLPAFVLTDIQDGIGRSFNWPDVALGPPYIVRPLLLLAVMALAHFVGIAATGAVAMASALIATWFAAMVQAFALNRRLKAAVPAGPRRREPGVWFRTALPILMVEGFYMLLTHCDILVLEHFTSPADVAIYWSAVKTLALVAFIYFSVAAAVAHRFAEYHATGAHEELKAFVRQAVRWTFFPSLLAIAVLAMVGKPILWLFGPQFTEGYPVMMMLALGLLCRASIGPVERLLSMSGHQKVCAVIYAAAFSSNIALALILVPRFGMMGAAGATACSLGLESLMLFLAARRHLQLNVFVWAR